MLCCTSTTYQPYLRRADVRMLDDRLDQRALAERLVTDFASHFPAELELLFLSAGFEIIDRAAREPDRRPKLARPAATWPGAPSQRGGS